MVAQFHSTDLTGQDARTSVGPVPPLFSLSDMAGSRDLFRTDELPTPGIGSPVSFENPFLPLADSFPIGDQSQPVFAFNAFSPENNPFAPFQQFDVPPTPLATDLPPVVPPETPVVPPETPVVPPRTPVVPVRPQPAAVRPEGTGQPPGESGFAPGTLLERQLASGMGNTLASTDQMPSNVRKYFNLYLHWFGGISDEDLENNLRRLGAIPPQTRPEETRPPQQPQDGTDPLEGTDPLADPVDTAPVTRRVNPGDLAQVLLSQNGAAAPIDNRNCGPTCLAMVERLLGVQPRNAQGQEIPFDPNNPQAFIDGVRQQMRPGSTHSDETTYPDLLRGARSAGLHANEVHGVDAIVRALNEGKAVISAGNPAAAGFGSFDGRHLILITGMENGRFVIADPMLGQRSITREELQRYISHPSQPQNNGGIAIWR